MAAQKKLSNLVQWDTPLISKLEPDYARLELVEAFSELFKTGDRADMIIVCGSHRWKFHQCIVCPQSKFFAAACKDVFKEAEIGQIDLSDDDPEIVRKMLEYFYTLNYTTNYPDAYVRLDIHARMYAIADKYEIKALKTIAAMNFQSEFPHAVEQAAWRSELPQEIVTLRCTVATCVWEKVCFLSLSPNFKKMLAQISDLAFDLVMEASRLQELQKCENMEKW